MSTLVQELDRYLAIRRSLGYDLSTSARVLRRFVAFACGNGAKYITTDLFLAWQAEFVRLKVRDICHGDRVAVRAIVMRLRRKGLAISVARKRYWHRAGQGTQKPLRHAVARDIPAAFFEAIYGSLNARTTPPLPSKEFPEVTNSIFPTGVAAELTDPGIGRVASNVPSAAS
jgi:hypothetical protein